MSKTLLSTGQIAELLGTTIDVVNGLIRRNEQIKPFGHNGPRKLFDADGVEAIKAAFTRASEGRKLVAELNNLDRGGIDAEIWLLKNELGEIRKGMAGLIQSSHDAAACLIDLSKRVAALEHANNGNAASLLELAARVEAIEKSDKAGPAQRAGGRLSNV